MKKYFSILALATLIMPSVAFASWWNPFTWFNSTVTTDTKTAALEQRIAELESKINNNVATTTATSTQNTIIASTTIATTTPAVKKVVKKTVPAIDNSAIIEAQVKAQVEAEIKAKADQDALIAKQKADEQASLDTLKAEADQQAAQNAANIVAQQAAEQQAADDATQAKQAKLDAINLQIANLNAKYASDSATIKHSSGGTVAGVNAELDALYSTYLDNYNALMAQYQQIKYTN